MEMIRSIFNKIYVFLFLRKPETKVVTKKRKTNKINNEALGGQYLTIKRLLGDLDALFDDLKRLKPKSSANQRIIKKYGPYMSGLEADDGFSYEKLESFEAYGFPSFLIGYINRNYINLHRTSDKYVQCIMVATKMESIGIYRKKKEKSYYKIAYIAIEKDKDYPFEFELIVKVDNKTGNVTALPELLEERIVLEHRGHTRKKVGRSQIIKKINMDYPNIFDDDKPHTKEEKKKVIEENFIVLYNIVMRREYGVNIIVKKDGYRATICVPQNRWKYFFKDRVKVNGKRIFHAVASHTRETKSGTSNVKTHYRGLRKFNWNGYDVNIVMPGKHGVSQADFNLSAIQANHSNSKYRSVTGKCAEKINEMFEGIQ